MPAPVPEPAMSTPRRVVLITGAARRIGAAIAHRVHAEGYDVALHYRGSAGDMQSLVAELEAARAGSTLMLQADLADRVELCAGCEWWFEPCELCCGHDVHPYCSECRLGGECEECIAAERGE